MIDNHQHLVKDCVDELERGTLTKQQLLDAFDSMSSNGKGRKQDLLYLQACESSLESTLLGMRMLVDGKYADEPEDDDAWPYKTIIDAINDGWRVISFPNMALSLDENHTYGLGFEFILEKWR